jgi:hypothetical protein
VGFEWNVDLRLHSICPGVPNSRQFDRQIFKPLIFRWTLTGLHLADASIWISTVMSLAVFDISKVVENGVEITPDVDPLPGTIRYVAYFVTFGASVG